MNKKYKLRKDLKIEFRGKTLYRIEAKKSFHGVVKGDLGGFIEKESNLSGDGNSWVSDNARVSGNALVSDNAWVSGYTRVTVSPIVLTNVCKWNLTITDSHLQVGCIIKTYNEWIDWLITKDEYGTPRYSDEFKKIEVAIRCAVELAKSTGRFENKEGERK